MACCVVHTYIVECENCEAPGTGGDTQCSRGMKKNDEIYTITVCINNRKNAVEIEATLMHGGTSTCCSQEMLFLIISTSSATSPKSS